MRAQMPSPRILAEQPDYVLILSGDPALSYGHGEMLACHRKNNADLAIAVMPVPWEEASHPMSK